jgi:two-component system, LytTR family, response regulator
MRCIIVDDEPNAIDILQRYAARIEYLEVTGSYRDPVKALRALQEHAAALAFLGMQLLASLPQQPLVIFTTAYPQFAVESYEYNAVDYLVKPISFDRFLKAVNKAYAQYQLLNRQHTAPENDSKDVILLKSGTQLHRVNKHEVLYFEKDSNYIVVHTPEKKILVRGNMQDVFEWVPAAEFFQLHKSFIVNMALIDIVEVHQVTIKGRKLPIGSTYRDAFLERLHK